MFASPYQAQLGKIRLHPIKSLDPVEVREARIGPNGGLEFDRAWALHTADGRWLNGKRTPLIHHIRAEFAPDIAAVTLSSHAPHRALPPVTLAFPGDTESAAAWFRAYFAEPVAVRYAPEGFPDDDLAPGPTIVSTASLEAVCQWFPGLTLESARQRFRATLEITGDRSGLVQEKLPAFWEDRLFGPDKLTVVRFRIGGVLFEGSNPCARCAVPPRDPRTAAPIEGFQKRFAELRQAQLPAWSPASRFDHFYRFAVNTRVPPSEAGKLLRTGDPLQLL
ncbi:MAG: MOSC N-terminal beta barrel domain-containing protein [Acidobacteriia bacterium]|nr:MOSC N-terminal beta barrel domain-containing protein [Terriglobia bacterium]